MAEHRCNLSTMVAIQDWHSLYNKIQARQTGLHSEALSKYKEREERGRGKEGRRGEGREEERKEGGQVSYGHISLTNLK